jgi:MYXO-CTERM domain-containing protein
VGLLALLGSCGGEELESEVRTNTYPITAAVEQWRKLVEKHFKYQHVTWGLNIIQCESGGDPNAYNSSSGASGLFQHLKQYWPARATAAGFPGASPFNAEANIAASAYLLYAAGGGPQHWSCKYSPFENFSYQPQFYKNGVAINPTPPTPPAPCPTLPASGGVIDEAGPCFTAHGPEEYWRSVSGQGQGGGLRWTNATQQASPSNWARWEIILAAAGKYTVYYYAVTAYAVFDATRYVLHHDGIDSTLTVDQSVGGTGWRSLGEFSFAKGGSQHLSVYDNTAKPVGQDQHIIADAIKLVPVAPPTPAPAPTPDPPAPPTPDPPAADGGVAAPPADGSALPEPEAGQTPPAWPGTVPPASFPEPDPPAADPSDPTLAGGCSVGAGEAGQGWPALFFLLLIGWRRRDNRELDR